MIPDDPAALMAAYLRAHPPTTLWTVAQRRRRPLVTTAPGRALGDRTGGDRWRQVVRDSVVVHPDDLPARVRAVLHDHPAVRVGRRFSALDSGGQVCRRGTWRITLPELGLPCVDEAAVRGEVAAWTSGRLAS